MRAAAASCASTARDAAAVAEARSSISALSQHAEELERERDQSRDELSARAARLDVCV